MSFDIGPNFYLVSPDTAVLGSAQLHTLILDKRGIFIRSFHCVELFNRSKSRYMCIFVFIFVYAGMSMCRSTKCIT